MITWEERRQQRIVRLLRRLEAAGAVWAIVALALVACTPSYYRYVGPTNSTEQQFLNARYACYQETRQRTYSAYVDVYGGAASSQVLPPCDAFRACLGTRGYFQAANTKNLNDFQAPGNFFIPKGQELRCTE
jgi:hypothetical protein